jgi:uncharacterized membrane protein
VHRRGWWSPLRITLLALGGALVLGYLQKVPCRATVNWKDSFQLTHACYTDVVASWGTYGLNEGDVPYVDSPIPYPPLTGGFMGVAGSLASLLPEDVRQVGYFDVTVVMLAALAAVVVVTTALLASRRRPWDALMVAISPVLVFHAYTNWDLLSLALLGVALVAWSRGSPAWAGVWLGLAVAAKLWPAVLLLALLLLCWRADRMREWLRMAVATVGVWAIVTVPLLVLAPDGSGIFWSSNVTRGPDWDSLWLPLRDGTGWPDGTVLTSLVVALCIVIAGAVAVLVARAPRRPRVPQVMFVLLALFLIVGKVFSPQDALWLTPLAVLARPRWRAFLVWQASEVLLTVMRMLMLMGLTAADKGLPRGWWYVTVSVRDLALLALVALVIREMVRPELDVVRDGGEDDPAGGPLDGAPDRHPRAPEDEDWADRAAWPYPTDGDRVPDEDQMTLQGRPV